MSNDATHNITKCKHGWYTCKRCAEDHAIADATHDTYLAALPTLLNSTVIIEQLQTKITQLEEAGDRLAHAHGYAELPDAHAAWWKARNLASRCTNDACTVCNPVVRSSTEPCEISHTSATRTRESGARDESVLLHSLGAGSVWQHYWSCQHAPSAIENWARKLTGCTMCGTPHGRNKAP